MIPDNMYSEYFKENISINRCANIIQISATCNAKCVFCSNEQNPFAIKRPKFRSVDEIKKILWNYPVDDKKSIILIGESVPGTISEGEVFLHPDIFEILKLIRIKTKNIIKITTNGSLLTEDVINKLIEFKPINVDVSFHSSIPEEWSKIFNLNIESYYKAIEALKLLKKNDLLNMVSIVGLPNLIGYNHIEETIKFLSQFSSKINLSYPGYTKYTDNNILHILQHDENEFKNFAHNMIKKYNIIWSLDPSSNIVYYTPIDFIIEGLKLTNKYKVVFLSSTAAYERVCKLIDSLGFKNFEVIQVYNKSYGGNIKVSGLWMVSDVIDALKDKVFDIVYLPGNFLDSFGFDLMGTHISILEETFMKKFRISPHHAGYHKGW